jgi:hypothetical protein
MRLAVIAWIKSGSPLPEGIRIFSQLARQDHPFIALLRADPVHLTAILRQELAVRVGLTDQDLTASDPSLRAGVHKSFRQNWPFLQDPDCPAELKILAADKITAWYRYTQAHEQLFDCTSLEEMRDTARDLMAHFLQNRLIIDEFRYYREHKSILGKHPIFSWTKQLRALRKLNPVALVEKRIRLEHNVWRIESELAKNKKPHLRITREQALRSKKMQLVEVNNLISKIES